MTPGTLNLPAKKKEAARIDQENYKFAQRIMKQKPTVDRNDKLEASFKRSVKNSQMLSANSRISMNKLV